MLLQRAGIDAKVACYRVLDSHDQPLRKDGNPYANFRETRSVPDQWKQLLSDEEVRAVLTGAEPFEVEELQRSTLTE